MMFLTTKRCLSPQQGFTLIELLVVISIIGILAGLLLTNFVGIRGRAADAQKKNDVRQLKTALRLYYNDNQAYPDESSMPTSGAFDNGAGTVYMAELPVGFSYYSDGGEGFLIEIPLDNASDEDIAASVTKCDPEGTAYFDGSVDANDYFVCQD